MKYLVQDLHYILRVLIKRPSYTVVTILILALAIGANTAIFSIFNGFYLRPLPYPDDDRLVAVYNTYPKMDLDFAGTSIPDYLDRREQAKSLENLAIFYGMPVTLGGDGPPERILITRASPSLFSVFKTYPVLGRVFTGEEATPGNEAVAVLSHGFWQTRFGADPGLLGGNIELDGTQYRVIGIMPEHFVFPDRTMDAWVPYAFTPEQMSDAQRGQEFSMSVGRLRPGASVENLNAEMDAIVRRNLESGRLPQGEGFIMDTGFTGRAQLLRDRQVGDYRQMLLILQGIVFAVLLIACANVASLQLARMASRRKELSTRAALGADSRRLAWLVLSESFLLAIIGAVTGLSIAYAGLELVRVLGIDHSTQGFEFVIDPVVLAFTAGIGLLATVASAIFPLIALRRIDLARAVHEAGRLGGGGRHAQGFRNTLTVVQIAVSVALLAGAGLLTKSFYRLQQEGTGFNINNVWTARIALPVNRYQNQESQVRFFQQALEQLQALPGVAQAGYTSTLPFSGNNSQGNYFVAGYVPPEGTPPPHAQHRNISEGYLPSLDIPVIKGRNFTASEPEPVVIVDENLARKYWPDGDPLGQRISDDFRADSPDSIESWYTIVGVVPAIKHASLTDDPTKETVYWHYRQQPWRAGVFTLKTALPPEELTRAASSVIHQIDPQLALADVRTMEDRVLRSLGPQRTPMVLTMVFAMVAFTLAVIGIYGVLTWSVTQRFGEFGVRMALGANMDDILRLVLRQGGKLIIVGLVIGVAGAVGLGRIMSSQIYNVSPTDPAVLILVITGLTITAFIASWLPARRAARIDPMQALREE